MRLASRSTALANKDVFDLASLGLAYGMYFNVTRDPEAEAELLAVRDLLFDKYYDPADQPGEGLAHSRPADRGGHRRQRWRHHQPAGAGHRHLPAQRRAADRPGPAYAVPRRPAQAHREPDRPPQEPAPATTDPWWFWGRTLRFGNFNAAQTDFGHNIKSYEMIHNANQMFADRPWSGWLPTGTPARPRLGRPRRGAGTSGCVNFIPGPSSATASGGSTPRPTRPWLRST